MPRSHYVVGTKSCSKVHDFTDNSYPIFFRVLPVHVVDVLRQGVALGIGSALHEQGQFLLRAVAVLRPLGLRNQHVVAIAVLPLVSVVYLKGAVVIAIVHRRHQDRAALAHDCQTIFRRVLVLHRVGIIRAVLLLNQISVAVILVGRSRVAPDARVLSQLGNAEL